MTWAIPSARRTTYPMTIAPGKSLVHLQVDSVRRAFALQCNVSTAAKTFESKPLDDFPSWDLTSTRLQAITSTKLPPEFRRNWAGGPRCCSVFRVFLCLCWSWSEHHQCPHAVFGNFGDSSLATLTITSLNHVTKMLSPAFDANTPFHEVNESLLHGFGL